MPIALADDKILAVGSDVDILALKIPATRVINLDGRTLMPGFIDTHSHLLTEGVNNPAVGSIQKAQELALQAGITTLGNLYTSPGFLAEMQALDDSGGLLIRTSLYMPYANACGEVEGNWYQQYPPTHQPGEMLRIAGVKLYTDGGSCGYPATSFNRQTGGEGDLWFTQEELNTIVSDIDAAGYQAAIHAIGDRAVEQALNAIEFTLHGRPNTLRHRIEHNTTVNPVSYARYQEIGVVPTIIGNVWSCNEVFFTKAIVPDPGEYQDWNFPYRAMFDASPGAHFAWHTDYPWASVNPLYHLYSLVTPNEIAGDLSECPDPTWVGDKTLALDEALSMMTMGGAYAMFRDQEVGSLVPGKYADLIVLSGNPADDLNTIKNLEVWMTMVAGQERWCAPGHDGICPNSLEIQQLPTLSPSGFVRFQVRMATTSDWATLTLINGGTLNDLKIISWSPEATDHGASDNRISINQTIERANSGGSVEMVVDVTLSDVQTSGQLEYLMESGALGYTNVKFYTFLQDSPVEASTAVLQETSETIYVPIEKLFSP